MCVRPLLTVADLVDEGTLMQHCVATHAHEAVNGTAEIYALEIDGRRLTLELREHAGHWTMFDLRGVGNRSASAHERALVEHWHCRRGAQPDQATPTTQPGTH